MIAFLAFLTLPFAPPPPVTVTPDPAGAAFFRLKTMVGTWRRKDDPASPLRIRYYLTARDTVLVEEWSARGKPHSLTLYHRDGSTLLATHYCPQGNQPRLALSGNGPVIRFAFRDATDLDPKRESHQHALSFDLADPANPVRGETYRSAGGDDESDRMVLERLPDAP